jgi:hypothetical protein
MSTKPILLAAGGTGGHLFPAAALAQELARRGYTVELATDIRAEQYGDDFPARAIHRIPSATITGRNPVAMAKTFSRLGVGYFGALRLLKKIDPSVVIGFGGYPTLPPIIAARTLKVPTAIHEQNAVMGRANRLLARVVDRVALSFSPTKKLHKKAEAKARVTGTPVRDAVLAYRKVDYIPPEPAGRRQTGSEAAPPGKASVEASLGPRGGGRRAAAGHPPGPAVSPGWRRSVTHGPPRIEGTFGLMLPRAGGNALAVRRRRVVAARGRRKG